MLVWPPVSPSSGVFFFAATLLSGLAPVTVRSTTSTEVTRTLQGLLVADAAWALSSVVPLEASTPTAALVGEVVRIVAGIVAAYVWFVFALVYSDRESVLTRRRLAVVAAPLVGHALCVVTNPLHGASGSGVTVDVGPTTPAASSTPTRPPSDCCPRTHSRAN